MPAGYLVGLDLGQTSDPTAAVVLEQSASPARPLYSVAHIERFPLGTSYPTIVTAVAELCATPQLVGCTLVADQTGVGRPIVDMLRMERRITHLVPISITSGHAVSRMDDGSLHVPKKDLVACLQLLLQNRRFKIARGLPLAELLLKELQNFKVRITPSANETYGAWREGQHDDLVLAVALATWFAERHPHIAEPFKVDPSRSVMDEAPDGLFCIGGSGRSPADQWRQPNDD